MKWHLKFYQLEGTREVDYPIICRCAIPYNHIEGTTTGIIITDKWEQYND